MTDTQPTLEGFKAAQELLRQTNLHYRETRRSAAAFIKAQELTQHQPEWQQGLQEISTLIAAAPNGKNPAHALDVVVNLVTSTQSAVESIITGWDQTQAITLPAERLLVVLQAAPQARKKLEKILVPAFVGSDADHRAENVMKILRTIAKAKP